MSFLPSEGFGSAPRPETNSAERLLRPEFTA